MAYIGREPVNGFHAKQTLSTDGSTVTFTLDFSVADETSIIVSVGGVLQEPKVAYNLAAGGTQLTFTAAPAATDTAYIHYLGQSIVQNLVDLNGVALVLDADADTTIAADTDDQIDIQIAGADDFQFTANKFSVLTGSSQSFADSAKGLFGTGDDLEIYHDGTNSLIANKTGALKIATETSGIAVTIGHTTSETTVADNLSVTGNLTVGGTTSFGDFDITNVGSIALDTITNDGTDITLDSSADIVIDAAGGNIEFKDAGTLQLTLDMDGTAGAQVIQLGVDSDDLIFKQYDGTTVLTLDDDTTVKVATDLTVGDDLSLISDSAVLKFGADSDTTLTHTDGAGLTLNSTNKLMFNDASQFIQGASATVLDIAATDEIELTATLIDVVGNATVSGTLGVTGVTTSNAGIVVDNITIDGTEIDLSSGDLLIDVAGDIILDAGGSDISLKGAGSEYGKFNLSSNSLNIHSSISDGDIVFKGNDGGSAITALTLDMSAAGAATFNDKITAVGTSVFTNLDISGDIDVDGTTNLDVVDIDGALTQDGGAVFNEAGADVDFRIESASNTSVFFVNAGASHVSVGTDGDFGGVFNVSGETVMKTGGNSDTLTLTSTDTDADAGPNLNLYRNSANPADGDLMGKIVFTGESAGSGIHTYGSIVMENNGITDGQEQGKLKFNISMPDGALANVFNIGRQEICFNEDSEDLDLRVESNGNTHQLFVDGGNDRIYVGGGTGSSIGSNKFQVQNGGATISSFANDSGSNQLHFIKSRNTTVGSQTIVNDGDSVGGIFWKADDGDATDYNNNVAGIEAVIDGTPGTNDTPGRLVFYTTNDGERTNTERMRITKDGKVGIGKSDPTTTFQVLGQISLITPTNGNGMSTNCIGTPANYSFDVRDDNAFMFRIDPNKRIQTNNDTNMVGHLNLVGERGQNNRAIDFENTAGGGTVGDIRTANASVSYNTSSDYRLKENVTTSWDATTRLKQLKPSRFNFKIDADTTVDGFLAHEVSSIVPEAITGEKDATETKEKVVLNASGIIIAKEIEEADWTAGKEDETYPSDSTWEATKVVPVYQGIDQSKLVPLLVKTIQELEVRIKSLEDA